MLNRRLKHRKRSPLQLQELQALESRCLLHAGSVVANGILEITADQAGGRVDVFETPGAIPGFRELNVRSTDIRGDVKTTNHSASGVSLIRFSGGANDDVFVNDTELPSAAIGGDGNDALTGGSANDTLHGGSGLDTILGSSGNDSIIGGNDDDEIRAGNGSDTIEAGSGHDFVWGGNGDDLINAGSGNDQVRSQRGSDTVDGSNGRDSLWGGGHNDRLRGGGGNDALIGGGGDDHLLGDDGRDHLSGGSGLDLLFGGIGWLDQMHGGSGSDRFLQDGDAPGSPGGGLGEDSLIRYSPATDTTIHFTDPSHSGAIAWDNASVERVDAGLELIHEYTRNNTLLKNADGSSIRFMIDTNCAGLACFGDDVIGMEAGHMANGTDLAIIRTVTHEIGHIWDRPGTNSIVNAFRTQSDWQESDQQPTPGHERRDTETSWWYRTGSEFARNHARENPREDFASTFSAAILNDSGLEPRNMDNATSGFTDWLTNGADAPGKAQLVIDWLDSL